MTEPDPRRRRLPGSLPIGRGCFACGPDNPAGLSIDYEQIGDCVEATFTLGEEFSGAPSFIHGGIAMTVLDDAMAWAAIAVRERFAVTVEFSATFKRPVLVDDRHTLRVTVGNLDSDGRTVPALGEIRRRDGKVCVQATATYHAMTPEEVARISGSDALAFSLRNAGDAE
ncbi:MAG: PaaI family thioesterase [Actinobacteria bacterium]|nr:PaaI family thioesterase [Actinomycetota bacterium]